MPSTAGKRRKPKQGAPHLLHQATFALASDGTVLVNTQEFDGVMDLESALACARREGGPVFVGIALTKTEAESLLPDIADALSESAAYIVGARQIGQRRGGRPGRRVRG